MMDWIYSWFEDRTFGAARSPKWSAVRKSYLALHPKCAVCGKKSTLISPNEAHHCKPFHLDASLELDPKNLITLCRVHHQWWGHLGSWKSFNATVREDAAEWNTKITNRP